MNLQALANSAQTGPQRLKGAELATRSQNRRSALAVNCFVFLLLLCGGSTYADPLPTQGLTAATNRGMVVSVSRPASEVGQRILDAGGNAVDAAVAVGLALAVTWPEAGNIGGGGFMLVHPGTGKPPVVIDYRERAPAAATVDMFVDGSRSEYLKVGVPGTVRGLMFAHQRYGRLTWQAVVRPSIELAAQGFAVSEELADSLNKVVPECRENSEFLRVFGNDGGRTPWQAGDRLVQPDLAATLQLIETEGGDTFYSGTIADAIESEMAAGGGLITKADLGDYQATARAPIHGRYRDYEIFASSPPSSGGTVLMQMLNMAEGFELRREGRWSGRTLHLMIECMRRAYYDRARYLGDPDFVAIPPQLVTKEYADQLRKSISQDQARPSAQLGAEILERAESPHTTHFSVIDAQGMAVSNTYTLEDDFGSRIVVRGAGFLLNNEMGDFNPKPGVTDTNGLIGTKPNLIQPGKRMLSSMCPVIVTRNNQIVLITGSPGGRTIINTLFCVLLNVMEFEMPLREAVDAPRMHHAWMPDRVQLEGQLNSRHKLAVMQLRKMGHAIDDKPTIQGDAHSISVLESTGEKIGTVDSRRGGWAAGQK